MTATTPFEGFSDGALAFLRDLRANNERAWFNDHKKTYEDAIKKPAQAFCHAMTASLEALTGKPHGHKIFRIHRDVRFSKDKTPYNTHLHIAFMPTGGPSAAPPWFFGLDTDSLALGTGIFAFDKAGLERFRTRVLMEDGAALERLMQDLKGDGVRFGEPDLRRTPSGYDKDHPRAVLLRHKGLSAWIDHANPNVVTSSTLIDRCMQDFQRLKPLFDWLSI